MPKYIKKYVGETIDGVYITKAGILSACLLGHGHVMDFLDRNPDNLNHKDGNGTSIRSRLMKYDHIEIRSCF